MNDVFQIIPLGSQIFNFLTSSRTGFEVSSPRHVGDGRNKSYEAGL